MGWVAKVYFDLRASDLVVIQWRLLLEVSKSTVCFYSKRCLTIPPSDCQPLSQSLAVARVSTSYHDEPSCSKRRQDLDTFYAHSK